MIVPQSICGAVADFKQRTGLMDRSVGLSRDCATLEFRVAPGVYTSQRVHTMPEARVPVRAGIVPPTVPGGSLSRNHNYTEGEGFARVRQPLRRERLRAKSGIHRNRLRMPLDWPLAIHQSTIERAIQEDSMPAGVSLARGHGDLR